MVKLDERFEGSWQWSTSREALEGNMLKKNGISLMLCAVMLSACAPSKAFAQALAQRTPAGVGQGAGESQLKLKPDLRAAFAEVTAKSRIDTVTEADIKRLKRLNSQAAAKPESGYTRKQKILVFSIVAGIVVLAVVLAFKTEKGGHNFCDVDPGDPDCLGAR
jgi:hypothetical protein